MKKRGRPIKSALEKKVLASFSKENALSINEVSQKVGIGWHTAENRLNRLKSKGRIREIRHKRIRLFFLNK